MPRKVSELNDLFPTDCPHVRQVRLEYAEWNWLPSDSYIRYYKGVQGKVYEHQLVAKRAYGATDGLHVHHLNGNTKDNRADNLQVLTSSEHARAHRGVAVAVACQCAQCGKSFSSTYEARYCSNQCKRLGQSSRVKPPKERLEYLMRTISNFSELGRMFGVSDNAVRKWAKSYKIDLSICDGRRTVADR